MKTKYFKKFIKYSNHVYFYQNTLNMTYFERILKTYLHKNILLNHIWFFSTFKQKLLKIF
jgi:hypothetical protein